MRCARRAGLRTGFPAIIPSCNFALVRAVLSQRGRLEDRETSNAVMQRRDRPARAAKGRLHARPALALSPVLFEPPRYRRSPHQTGHHRVRRGDSAVVSEVRPNQHAFLETGAVQ